MKIYMDMCSLQRPFDAKSQLRILVEAEAVLGIMSLCESGMVELIASDALVYESDANPNAVRRDYAAKAIAMAKVFVASTDSIKARARPYIVEGIKPLDALHLASAIEARANYFCTCDDRFLKKARSLDTESTEVVSPLDLIAELQ